MVVVVVVVPDVVPPIPNFDPLKSWGIFRRRQALETQHSMTGLQGRLAPRRHSRWFTITCRVPLALN